jgi:Holliday junction resolvase RusA-like endonuclease
MTEERKPGTIAFAVFGEPKPQGSKRSQLIRRKGGQVVMRDGQPLSRVRDDNPKTAEWKQQVAYAARQVYDGPLLTGPLSVTFLFFRPRPKAHFGSGRNSALLKPSAPEWPIPRPDTLKLARAVEDALTGVLWQDDSQVVEHRLLKSYGEHFRVEVEVQIMESGRR